MSKMFEGFKEVIKKYYKLAIFFIVFSLLICIVDQISKWAAYSLLGPLNSTLVPGDDLPSQYGQSVTIIPGLLNFTLLTNNGAAFGMGGNTLGMRIVFIIISWAVFIFLPLILLYFLNKHKFVNKDKLTFIHIMYFIALIFIYGGNLGNLIDRTFYWGIPCGVIDFIDISPLIPNFGVFNIADSFVVIGVLLVLVTLIIEMFKGDDKSKKELESVKTNNSTNQKNSSSNDKVNENERDSSN